MFSSFAEKGLTTGAVHIKDGLGSAGSSVGLGLAIMGLFIMIGLIQLSKTKEDRK